MFKSDDDVRDILRQIGQLKDTLDQHVQEGKLDQPVTKESLFELERIKLSVGFFREFIQNFLKSKGITQEDLAKNMRFNVKGRDPEAEKLLREADSLKCQILISEATLIKKKYEEFFEKNRPFTESKKTGEAAKEIQKQKVKKKFKAMERRQKWNKM